jgi:hypothetical protein
MKTTNSTHARVLVLGLLSACQLPPDLLEVGDEESESESTSIGESSETTETGHTGDTGDTGDPELGECVLQGSDLDGAPTPESDFSLPDCEVVCAEGWGHDVPWLESEWTEEPVDVSSSVTRGALAITRDDYVTMTLSGPNLHLHRYWFEPQGGDFGGTLSTEPIDGEVLGYGVDVDDGIHYYLWTDGVVQRLVAMAQEDVKIPQEVIFDIELGPHYGSNSTLDVLEDGVVIVLDGENARLLRADQMGNIVFDHVIPTIWKVDVSPSGNVIALANFTTINWADADGNYLGSHEVDQITALYGLVATDDTHVVFAGGEPTWNGMRGFLHEFGEMGPGWSRSYDRADAWCGGPATQERFTDIDQLADGTLVVTGVESLGHPYGDDIVDWSQPWVAHVSADGELLAYDRGLWLGRAIDVVADGDVAWVLLTQNNDYGTFGSPYVRKYAF